jgi:HAE1 family hydrophobic/amphiphilic exporter-1
MSITELSLRRPVTTLMVFVSFIVIGVIASRLLPLEFFPDISFPGAYVSMPYPASTPQEVERLITRPVEEALATIGGIEEISSESRENSAGVFVRFKMGSDIAMKSMEIREKIDGVRNQLPDDLERVFVFKFSAQDEPIMNLRISSERDISGSYDMLNRNLKMRIERLSGVSKMEMYGVQKKRVRIDLVADRVAGHNINLAELASELQQTNFSVTAGKINDSGKRFVVRPIGEITTAIEMEELVIGPDHLRLKDIADVTYGLPEEEEGRHLDQKFAIGFDVFKESGANTVEVADLVLQELDKINELPEMRGIQVYEMNNQATGIISSLEELFKAGILGAIFSILVLFFFLRRIGTTMIVATAVPFSIVVTLGVLYFMGFTLNILSMMGLMLAVGMLVDNAVVVTENIHRYQLMEPDRKQATILGAKTVGMAVTAGTLTSIIVFLPNVVSETSMIAIQLKHVAVSIIIALVASLLISLTVIPLLTSRLPVPEEKKDKVFFKSFIEKYGNLLDWLLRHRYAAAGLVLVVLFSVMIPQKFVKMDMFPRTEDRELRLHLNLNNNYVLERVEQAVDRIEDYLYAHQEALDIETVYSYYRSGYASATIILTEGEQITRSVEEIKKTIEEGMPTITIGSPAFEYRDKSGGSGISVNIIGESSERLLELAEEVEWRLAQIPGISDVRSEAETGNEEVQLVVDRDRARSYGLSASDVAGMVSGAMRGRNLRRLRTEDGEVDVILAFQDADRQSVDQLMNMPIFTGNQTIPLASLARYEMRGGPQSIHRQDRQTSLALTANLDGITSDEAKEVIAAAMDNIQYPTGYGWSYGRSFREDAQAMDEMITNILLALVLIYLVLASLFESILYPTSIITSILFAVIGVFWFFLITGTTFSLMAMIGILILMGIVVNNGIVLIDHINQLRASGLSRRDAIVQGGMDRMRPILMTAGTTVLGLLPLCFGTTQIGGDGPPYFPMARAIVGGLTFSTVVTMIILPTIYVMLDDLKKWSSRILQASRIS